jgi:hypothetical protein
MTPLAWIVLLAASTSVDLVDEVYQIPSEGWFCVPIDLRQQPALVAGGFHVEAGSQNVRLILVTQTEFQRLRNDLPHGLLAVTATGRSGAFRYRVRHTGDYVLVVDNRSNKQVPTTVRLRVALDFAHPTGPEFTLLSSQRQLTVIVLSFAFFFAAVTYSARKLLRAAKRT